MLKRALNKPILCTIDPPIVYFLPVCFLSFLEVSYENGIDHVWVLNY